jgi:transglutaminase-like putative cysteine protease
MTVTLYEASVDVCSVEQHIRYDYSKPVTDLRQRLMVVPPPRHGRQQRVDWSVDVRGASAKIVRTGRESFGNLRIEIAVPVVPSWVEFHVRSTVAFCDEESAATVRFDERYLRPTSLTSPNEAIARLGAGCDRAPELICERVHRALTYEWGVTGVETTAADAMSAGRGVCQDYAHVMVAACRSVGVAARYVSGHLLGEGGSHAWVEVLHAHPEHADRWGVQAWDPTHCRRTDDSYITIATGRDYRDVAPMSGTFDGDGRGSLTVRKVASAGAQLGARDVPSPDRLAEYKA